MNATKYAVFTVDVEAFTDTECISSSGQRIEADLMDGLDEYLAVLDEYDIKGTMFTVGKLAPKIADRLHRHIGNGHRLALHSYEHTAPMKLSVEQFREDTRKAKELLTNLFDTEVEGFRAPCFSLDRERLNVLRELGFRYDSSFLGFQMARNTVPLDLDNFEQCREGIYCRNGFYEFEMSKQKIFGRQFPISGGGYVRLSNWDFVKTLLWQYIRRKDFYVFYLHPFEMTQRQIPYVKNLKGYDKFYLRYGIHAYKRKVRWIIEQLKKCGYQFVTFEELTQVMNRQRAENPV